MDTTRIEELAARVDAAAQRGETIAQLTLDEATMTVDEAYEIQEASVAQRLMRGESLVGMKMGLTSRAKMEQVGVHEPIYGRLTSGMVIADGATIALDGRCHPRIEPEIAFVMKRDIDGPVTDAQAAAAVDGVCAAMEIIDSRYRDFRFTLPDVVADNTSASGVILGPLMKRVEDVALGNLGIVMEVNGAPKEIGTSAAIYDHPMRALVELIRMLARRGKGLKAGQIVLAGAATAAVSLAPGDHVRAYVDELGSVEVFVDAIQPSK